MNLHVRGEEYIWDVKMNVNKSKWRSPQVTFGRGWKHFVNAHGLRLSDWVTFKLMSMSKFEVFIDKVDSSSSSTQLSLAIDGGVQDNVVPGGCSQKLETVASILASMNEQGALR
jgi:hypothetical protein